MLLRIQIECPKRRERENELIQNWFSKEYQSRINWRVLLPRGYRSVMVRMTFLHGPLLQDKSPVSFFPSEKPTLLKNRSQGRKKSNKKRPTCASIHQRQRKSLSWRRNRDLHGSNQKHTSMFKGVVNAPTISRNVIKTELPKNVFTSLACYRQKFILLSCRMVTIQ